MKSSCYYIIILFLLISEGVNAQYYRPLERIKSPSDTITKPKVWEVNITFGLNGSYTRNANVSPGISPEGLAASIALDLTVAKREGRFLSSNEFHFLSSFFKSGEKGVRITKVSDNLLTLHDWSLRNGLESKWYVNFIAKVNTPLISTYKNGYFSSDDPKQIKIEKFANAYDVNIAPGIKYAFFKKKLNISLSPYAVRLYGVTDQAIADQNIYSIGPIDETSGKAPKSRVEKKGTEINIWFDHNIKEIITFEYRVDISSRYTGSILNEGLYNGLFTTRFKLVKNLFLTHRGLLTGTLEQSPQKPEWRQTVLLSYYLLIE